MINPTDPRERRLAAEFQELKSLPLEYALFTIGCDMLSEKEAVAVARASVSARTLEERMASFLSIEDFEQRYPDRVPEKYLIRYSCQGLAKLEEKEEPKETSQHIMQVIFGWHYPSEPPLFVWHTPLWHPNIHLPAICIEGRRFSFGLMLADIILEIGRMVQYQSYNLYSPLDKEAAEWAAKNLDQFPIDKRDILDRRKTVITGSPLVEVLEQQKQQSGPLVELLDGSVD